jgi:hypothetical protein
VLGFSDDCTPQVDPLAGRPDHVLIALAKHVTMPIEMVHIVALSECR